MLVRSFFFSEGAGEGESAGTAGAGEDTVNGARWAASSPPRWLLIVLAWDCKLRAKIDQVVGHTTHVIGKNKQAPALHAHTFTPTAASTPHTAAEPARAHRSPREHPRSIQNKILKLIHSLMRTWEAQQRKCSSNRTAPRRTHEVHSSGGPIFIGWARCCRCRSNMLPPLFHPAAFHRAVRPSRLRLRIPDACAPCRSCKIYIYIYS